MNNAIQIKKLGLQDDQLFYKLIELFQSVFKTPGPLKADEHYLKKLLAKPDFIVYVLLIENEVAGGLTAYELANYYSEGSEIFIYDIAVKPLFQRKGLGRQLVSELKNHCLQNGINGMFVAANEEDEHALDFYRSTGGHPQKVVHFEYTWNKGLLNK
jgi:aminoglycoside 3-N-acetyltransferase I